MTAPRIRLERNGSTATLWLDRPPLNVLDTALMREARAAVAALPPPPGVRFLVFRGAGTRGFSAGADVGDHLPERVGDMLAAFHGLFRDLWKSDWVTIAAVHGLCLGGGMELATFCDFLVASRDATFGQPEINLACFPPVAAVVLPPRIGLQRAMDLVLTGRLISAEEAHRWGLVSTLVDSGGLDSALSQLLATLDGHSASSLALARRAMLDGSGIDFETRLSNAERCYLDRLLKTQDSTEGIRAFLDKRPPQFVGR